jgi:tight adherence protein B
VVPVTAPLAGLVVAALVLCVGWPTGARRPTPPGRVERSHAGWPAAAALVVDRVRPARRLDRRDAQLPDALEQLAAAMRGGLAIGPAIGDVARAAPEPLADDLRAVATALDGGTPVATALAGWAGAPTASRDVHLVVAALTVGARAGGEVARAVDGIAATLRERRALQAEVRALATQARASAGVLAVAPVAFAALVATIEPGAVAFLVARPLGIVCLLLGLGLEGIGAAWMARITRSVS